MTTVPKARNSSDLAVSVHASWPGMEQPPPCLNGSVIHSWYNAGVKQDGLFVFYNDNKKIFQQKILPIV